MPAAAIQRIDFHPLARGIPPEWASGWGQDEIAPWATIAVGEVSQRLRWIPPGRFATISPLEDLGRNEDEGPRPEVTIEHGFWMFATPCTQAFWQAVMRENPSQFDGPDRPVEKVSWDDCQECNGKIEHSSGGYGAVAAV